MDNFIFTTPTYSMVLVCGDGGELSLSEDESLEVLL